MAGSAQKLLNTARNHKRAGQYLWARQLLEEAREAFPGDLDIELEYADALMSLEDFETAMRVYARLAEDNPMSSLIFSNLGGALYRCRRMKEAKTVLEYALELNPTSMAARTNLGGVLQALGDLQGALTNALELVSKHPTEALAFNNLGSAFSDLNQLAPAHHAFETAIMLQPNQIDALTNLAVVESRLGNYSEAIRRYKQAITSLPKTSTLRIQALEFYQSFDHLRLGQLQEGWKLYDSGFSRMIPANAVRSPDRIFQVPRWDGKPLTGQRILVWREQGLGDEIRFAACLKDLAQQNCQIIFEASPRLVSSFRRAFPQIEVRPEACFADASGNLESVFHDFDLHIPVGSLMGVFRPTIEDFQKSAAFIEPRQDLVDEFRSRLSIFEGKKLVGVCWRSGLLSPVRNSEYTHLLDWKSVMQRDDCVFVNLQYGDSRAERAELRDLAGIEIVDWPDLDLKNDAEGVFALMRCLDLVVTVRTTVNNMAAAVGTPVLLLIKEEHWSLLGQAQYPWFPGVHTIKVPSDQPVAAFLPWVKELLDGLVAP